MLLTLHNLYPFSKLLRQVRIWYYCFSGWRLYVKTDEASPNFGNFTTYDLKVFDMADGMPGKITRINNEASKTDATCNNLLKEFTTICRPDESSCPGENEQSFQLSVEQVCERVDSAIKLKFHTV